MALPRTRTMMVLALSCAALAAVARAEAPAGGPAEAYFASYLRMQQAATGGVKVSAKPSNYYEHVEVAHVCLQESRLKDCRFVGCPIVSHCGCHDAYHHSYVPPQPSAADVKAPAPPSRGGGSVGIDCVNQISGTTQLAGCCNDYSTDSTDTFDLGSLASVGSCDFSVDLYRDPMPPHEYAPVEQAHNVWKIGGASGTCVLSEGADQCGGPLCDKLYLNFQGSAYLTYASSKFGGSNDGSDEHSCNELWSCENIDLPGENGGRRLQEADSVEVTAGATVTVSEDGSAVKRTLSQRVMHRLVEKTGLDRGGCAWTRRLTTPTTPTTGPSRGIAVIISGAFTVTSLEYDVGYSSGLLEYVPRFYEFPPGCELGLPADLHHVRPDAVRLMFTRGKRYE